MAGVVFRGAEAMEELLRGCLREKERVLICFPGEGDSPGKQICDMVLRCGATPVPVGEDRRWITLLHRGFSQRCGCLVGEAGVLLGLCKLARRMGTPLYARNCIVAGSEPDGWLTETIQTGLDCSIRGWVCPQIPPEPPDPAVERLERELRRWSSVLDYRLENTESGLFLEMVTFPGEKLPKLPTLAGRVLRQWNPEKDCPFQFQSMPVFFEETH